MRIWTLMIQRGWFSESEVFVFDSAEKVGKEFDKRVNEIYNDLKKDGWEDKDLETYKKDNNGIVHDSNYFYCCLGDYSDENEIGFTIQQHDSNEEGEFS